MGFVRLNKTTYENTERGAWHRVLVPLPLPLPILTSSLTMAFPLEHKMVDILKYTSCRAHLQKNAGQTPSSEPSLGSAVPLEPRPWTWEGSQKHPWPWSSSDDSRGGVLSTRLSRNHLIWCRTGIRPALEVRVWITTTLISQRRCYLLSTCCFRHITGELIND